MSFAENLKTLREENKLSQEDLAEVLGVSRQSISKYEQGKGYPEIAKLLILSENFGVSLDDLLKEATERTVKPIASTIQEPIIWSTEQRIHIRSYDGKSIQSYFKVYVAPIFKAKKPA